MSAKSSIVVSIQKDKAWSLLFSKRYNNKKLTLTFSEYFVSGRSNKKNKEGQKVVAIQIWNYLTQFWLDRLL